MSQRVVAAEDVMQREESTYDLESENTDAITLNDTEDSQYDEDASWPLDYILAEADTDESDTDGHTTRVRKYLVKWTGYSKAKATWQKRADFVGDAETVFFAWQEKRMREVRGHRDEFDLGGYQRYLDAIEHAKERRHEKRNKKRQKLKLDQVNYDAEDDADDEVESNDERPNTRTARGGRGRELGSGSMEMAESSDDDSNSGRPSVRVGSIRVQDDPEPYRGTMRPPTSTGRMPFAHSPSSAGSPVSTRSPSVDGSRRRPQAEPELKRKRRTNAEIERDDERMKALQRKKGIAVSKKSGATASAPTPRAPSTSRPKTIIKPTAPKAGSFFGNLKKSASKTATNKSAAEASSTSAAPTHITAAPVARMVGGPKQSKPKSVAQAAGSRPVTNIFVSVSAKQRKPIEPTAKFKSLSHQHNVFKKMRDELAPSIDQLQLIDPGTGLPITRTTSSTQAAAPLQIHPRLEPKADSFSTANQSGRDDSTLQSASELNAAFEAMHASNVRETNRSPAHVQSSSKNDDAQLGILYTCWYWATKGKCNFGHTCNLEHYNTGHVAPPDNRIPPSEITCWFWFTAKCRRPAELCKFCHETKRYLAQKADVPVRLDLKGAQITEQMTCWFWFFRKPPCRNPDNECVHAHHETKYVFPHAHNPNKGSLEPIPYEAALRERDGFERSETRLEKAELATSIIRSPPERRRSPPPRARRGRDDDEDEPSSTLINLPFQQQTAPDPSEFKIRDRATRERMNAIPATLRMKQLHNQLKEFGIVLDFAGEATKASFLAKARRAFEDPPLVLDITSLCIAELMRQYMDLNKQEMYASGEIISDSIDDSEIEKLLQTLRSHSGGCIVHHANFSMLIFPTGQQSWDFLKLPKAGPGIKLQFVVLPPVQPSPDTDETPQIVDAGLLEQEEGQSSEIVLDHDLLFHEKSRERHVFLLFHPNYAEEIDALMTSLHKAGAFVYLNSEAGSWEHFTKVRDRGTIIIHPSFDEFHRIPNLASIANTASFKFFSFGEISPDSTQTADPNSRPFIRLFPHGKAVFIMDSVLADQPQMAHAVVKELLPRLREAPSANCVLGRPDLLRWLQKLSVDEPDEVYSEVYALLATLLHSSPANLTMWPMPERPTSQSPVYFEPLFANPEYSTKYARAPHEAEEEMAEWFALWALRNVQRYKSFVIVSMANNRTVRSWTQKWGHVEVNNPMAFVAQSLKAETRKREYEEKQKREKAREKEKEREKTST